MITRRARIFRFTPTLIAGFTVLVVVAVGVGYILLPKQAVVDEATYRYQCGENVEAIVRAILAYKDDHGEYPPAFSIDTNGRPLHSWRVLILPYLGKKQLYGRFDLSKPWNDPANLKLLNHRPDIYRCPGHGRKDVDLGAQVSNYVMVVPGDDRIRKYRLVVTCVNRKSVPWTAPDDITLTKFLRAFDADEQPVLSEMSRSNHGVAVNVGSDMEGNYVQVFPRRLSSTDIRDWIHGKKSIHDIE